MKLRNLGIIFIIGGLLMMFIHLFIPIDIEWKVQSKIAYILCFLGYLFIVINIIIRIKNKRSKSDPNNLKSGEKYEAWQTEQKAKRAPYIVDRQEEIVDKHEIK